MKKLLFFDLLLLVFVNNLAVADVYDDLAQATGGTINKMTKQDFHNQTNDGKYRYGLLQNAVPVLIQSVKLTYNEKLDLSFPVDTFTFGSLVVEVTGDYANTATMTLTDPDGRIIQPLQRSGDPKLPVLVNIASNHTALIVPRPKEGNWTLQIANLFHGDLIIRTQSSINIQTAKFMFLGGRPGHQGYFPVSGPLKSGSNQLLELSINEVDPKSLELYLMDKIGNELKKIKILPSAENKETITANIDIPEIPFRIRLKGTDKKGKDFQRFINKIFNSKVN